MLIEKNQRLVFIGDSVTDCGRARPVAEGLFNPLGTGYPNFVNALLNTRYPERHIRVSNVGSSGNNARDLAARWETDVIALKPDWLSINIGINDVWRQFDVPYMHGASVFFDEYAETLERLVRETRPTAKGLILMTPHFLEPNREDPMRKTMDRYADFMRSLAPKYDCRLADSQALFDKILVHMHPAELAWDRIHPNQIGQMLMARAFLDAIAFEW